MITDEEKRLAEQEAELNAHIAAKFEPYLSKKTPKGYKIHLPLTTIIEMRGHAFVCVSLSKKRIVLRGKTSGLPKDQEIIIWDGLFKVSGTVRTAKGFDVSIVPANSRTFINPKGLER